MRYEWGRLKTAVFAVLGILFVVYFIIVSISWGRIDSFNKVMICIGLLWIMAAIHFTKVVILFKRLPRIFKICLKICLIVFVLSFVIVESVIISNMTTKSTAGADYVIILGCQVDGSIPSIPLLRRVNTAVQYLKENRNCRAVVTGGRGPGENISEAEAMKRILTRNGIDEYRILEENKSRSTMENFRFSNELYDLQDKTIVAASSDYHMFRALAIAKKLSYKNVEGLPCKSQLSILPAYLLREYAAIVYYILLRKI